MGYSMREPSSKLPKKVNISIHIFKLTFNTAIWKSMSGENPMPKIWALGGVFTTKCGFQESKWWFTIVNMMKKTIKAWINRIVLSMKCKLSHAMYWLNLDLSRRFFEVSISGVGSELFKNNLFSDNGFILERTQSHSSGGQKRPKQYFLIEITRQ